MERYLYHSFPRRGASTESEIQKGCTILASICDFGLLMVPEEIEWKQPCVDGTQRTFPVLQSRVCFTDLSPSELPQHAEKFGKFAIEFEFGAARSLGAVPVFYVPQPAVNPSDGNAVGVALIASAMDANALVRRASYLSSTLNGTPPVESRLNFDVGFVQSPTDRAVFNIDTAESRTLLQALGHGMTPLSSLSAGVNALLNFFYPADDVRHDRLLEYYRQREWRIACGFAISGTNVMHVPSDSEKQRFLSIDQEFFSRSINNAPMLDHALVHPGLGGRTIIEMARRIIVPESVIACVKQQLSERNIQTEVIAVETLDPDQS